MLVRNDSWYLLFVCNIISCTTYKHNLRIVWFCVIYPCWCYGYNEAREKELWLHLMLLDIYWEALYGRLLRMARMLYMLLILIIEKKGRAWYELPWFNMVSTLIDQKGKERRKELYLLMWAFFRHLNGTVLGSFVRPAVLITDAYNALNNQPYRRQKDKEFGGIELSNFEVSTLSNLLNAFFVTYF